MPEPVICEDHLSHAQVCVDKLLPDDQVVEAARKAIEENPENAPQQVRGMTMPDPFQMALLTRTKWQPGRTLTCTFLDGDPTVQQKVANIAKEWEKYANIKLQFVNDRNADIRISFRQQGSWSYLGTDNLNIPKTQPTMNYGWLQPNSTNETYTSVVLHEFGHALGCIHEHQNPSGNIQWNKEAAYQYYGRQGWNRQMVDQQVFQKYAQNITQFTALDAKSIMMYPVPKQLTLDGFEAGFNTVLSETDKQFIAQMYPGVVDPVDPVKPPIDTNDEWKKVIQAIIEILLKLLQKK